MFHIETYTFYSLVLSAGMPIYPVILGKMVGVNMIMVCIVGNSIFMMYQHKNESMIKWNMICHVVPLYPLILWYRYAECIGWRRHASAAWYMRFLGQMVLFLYWMLIPYRGIIGWSKAVAIYHHVYWWYLVEFIGGSAILHLFG